MASPGRSSFACVADLVRQRTGLAFSASRLDEVEAATGRAMERAGIADAAVYRAALASGSADFDDLVAGLTVHETYFLREPAHFAFLRDVGLPAIQRARPPDHVVRVWSAGCATGEEAYSLAMLLDEAGLGRRSYVLGSDLSGAVIDRARRGRYRPWALRGGEGEWVRRWFTSQGDELVLDESLRGRVVFTVHNLAEPSYSSLRSGIGAFDVVLCRNVLVYLARDAVRGIARRLFDALAPGGFLVTAGTDPVLADDAPFEVILSEGGLVYRRPEGARLGGASVSSRDVASPPAAVEPWLDPAPTPAAPAPTALSEARAAFAAGDWTAAATAAAAADDDPELAAVLVRALANMGEAVQASKSCQEAVARHPLSIELHYLHALLATDRGRFAEAVAAAERVVYLDPSSAPGFFVLGWSLERLGDAERAARAYRNALALAGARPPAERLPLGDGDCAGALAASAAAALQRLRPTRGAS